MRKLPRHLRYILVLVSSLIVVVPGFAVDTAEEFRFATEGYRYSFPRDHGAHEEFRTEWWYYTGQVTAKDGRPFGYELTFFRRGMPRDQTKTLPSQWAVTHLYLAHFAVSDLSKGRFHYADKMSRAGLGKAGAAQDRLHVWIDRWSAESPSSAPDTQILQAADGDMAIQFTVSPGKPLVVHGTDGISRKGSAPGQASHYYSFTRLATTGILTIGNESFDVTGTSWMDHEFGSADLDKDLVGWDWFSLQLDDQRELMLYRLRRADGSAHSASSGTLIDRNGQGHHLLTRRLHTRTNQLLDQPCKQGSLSATLAPDHSLTTPLTGNRAAHGRARTLPQTQHTNNLLGGCCRNNRHSRGETDPRAGLHGTDRLCRTDHAETVTGLSSSSGLSG